MTRAVSQHAFGIVCPRCRGNDAKVLRKKDGRGYVWRRHACQNPECLLRDIRWTSYQFITKERLRITHRKMSAVYSALL